MSTPDRVRTAPAAAHRISPGDTLLLHSKQTGPHLVQVNTLILGSDRTVTVVSMTNQRYTFSRRATLTRLR